jgi:hypothetical protein
MDFLACRSLRRLVAQTKLQNYRTPMSFTEICLWPTQNLRRNVPDGASFCVSARLTDTGM